MPKAVLVIIGLLFIMASAEAAQTQRPEDRDYAKSSMLAQSECLPQCQATHKACTRSCRTTGVPDPKCIRACFKEKSECEESCKEQDPQP